ncbi:hypothetical protein ACWFPY_34880 [Nocardia fluminea]
MSNEKSQKAELAIASSSLALVAIMFAHKYWLFTLIFLISVAILSLCCVAMYLIVKLDDRLTAHELKFKALRKRAEEQNALYLAGDSEGIYGEFPPVDLDGGSEIGI